jgi:hypothetical protein
VTVHILRRGDLTPQQVLAAQLNDPDFGEVETVIVLFKTKDGVLGLNWSTCKSSDKALLAAMLMDVAVKETRD